LNFKRCTYDFTTEVNKSLTTEINRNWDVLHKKQLK